jgi:hypothetical protein
MNNYSLKVVLAIALMVMAAPLQAYRYTFSNHTGKKIATALRFKSSKWYEFTVVLPNKMGTIAPGNKYIPDVQTEIGEGKAGYIPSEFFYYVPKANEKMTTANQQSVAWRSMPITWVPSEKYTAALELAEAVGNFTETAAKTAAKAGAAYLTGGASAGAEAATELAKTGAVKADVLKEFAGSDYSLGKFFGSIAKSAGYSMARNRHFDIVEDENGNLLFLSIAK